MKGIFLFVLAFSTSGFGQTQPAHAPQDAQKIYVTGGTLDVNVNDRIKRLIGSQDRAVARRSSGPSAAAVKAATDIAKGADVKADQAIAGVQTEKGERIEGQQRLQGQVDGIGQQTQQNTGDISRVAGQQSVDRNDANWMRFLFFCFLGALAVAVIIVGSMFLARLIFGNRNPTPAVSPATPTPAVSPVHLEQHFHNGMPAPGEPGAPATATVATAAASVVPTTPPPMIIYSVSVVEGPTSGGNDNIIHGENFPFRQYQVHVNGNPVSPRHINSQSVGITMPAYRAGVVSISVTRNSDGQGALLENAYRYVDDGADESIAVVKPKREPRKDAPIEPVKTPGKAAEPAAKAPATTKEPASEPKPAEPRKSGPRRPRLLSMTPTTGPASGGTVSIVKAICKTDTAVRYGIDEASSYEVMEKGDFEKGVMTVLKVTSPPFNSLMLKGTREVRIFLAGPDGVKSRVDDPMDPSEEIFFTYVKEVPAVEPKVDEPKPAVDAVAKSAVVVRPLVPVTAEPAETAPLEPAAVAEPTTLEPADDTTAEASSEASITETPAASATETPVKSDLAELKASSDARSTGAETKTPDETE